MKIAVVYNPTSGSKATTADEIRNAFGNVGKDLLLLDITKGIPNIRREIKSQNIELIVAAGGDGTVNAVAQVATSESMPMGVLPAGTLNHFAKDLGLPIELDKAAKIISEMKFKSIDYCTVNDHVYVNNSSIGLYPSAVKERENLQERLSKWPAAAIASIKVGASLETTHLGFEIEGKKLRFKTPLVFIGNNSYHLERIGFTNRKFLDKGNMYLYIVRASKASAFLRQVFLLIFGKRAKGKDYLALTNQELVISSPKKMLKVAVDGEVLSLKTPLIYKIHPKSLRIAVPK